MIRSYALTLSAITLRAWKFGINNSFELPPMEVKVHSHSRFANDSGIKWMCQTSAAILRKSTDGTQAKMNSR